MPTGDQLCHSVVSQLEVLNRDCCNKATQSYELLSTGYRNYLSPHDISCRITSQNHLTQSQVLCCPLHPSAGSHTARLDKYLLCFSERISGRGVEVNCHHTPADAQRARNSGASVKPSSALISCECEGIRDTDRCAISVPPNLTRMQLHTPVVQASVLLESPSRR